MKLQRGFTLLELMVVIAIIAIGSATAALALRDNQGQVLTREADRLAALLESARATSRAAGVPIVWHPVPGGFAWAGLPPGSAPLPTAWLDAQTQAIGNAALVLGPDPIIPAQAVVLVRGGGSGQPSESVRIATDGLRPFSAGAPQP